MNQQQGVPVDANDVITHLSQQIGRLHVDLAVAQLAQERLRQENEELRNHPKRVMPTTTV